MNPLLPNPTTGFLESASHYGTNFNSDRKLKLIETAQAYRKETGKWPDLGKLCDSIGINPLTFDRHIKLDAKFREAWHNIALGGKYQLESLMYDLSGKNPMYMFGWLRKHFPEEYNPEYKVSVTVDASVTSKLLNKADAYEADIVEE